MDINGKNIAAAFEGLSPAEEQKKRIYENIVSTESAGVKSSRGERFRIGRMGAAVAAAAAVLVSGTLAVSALGLIDLQAAFGRIFDRDVNKLEAITAVSDNYVTEGDDRLSLSLMAVGGTETEAVGAIKIIRNDGGTFPEKLILHDWQFFLSKDGENAFSGEGVSYDLTVENETTAVFQFRIFSGVNIKGKDVTFTFQKICEDKAYQRVFDSVFKQDPGSTEAVDKALNEHDAFIFDDGEWSISFPLDYNSECLDFEIQTPVKLRAFDVTSYNVYDFYDIGATVKKIRYSAISADITFEGDNQPLYLPDIKVLLCLSDGSEMEFRNIDVFADPYDYDGEYTIHCSFNYPVDINDIEKITVNGTPIELK